MDALQVDPMRYETARNSWPRACEKLQQVDKENPFFKGESPRFHDLRHMWKTNARRSGMDPEIREAILGHWFKERSVSEGYGFIDDRGLLKAVDAMSFDHGESKILVTSREKEETCAQNVRKTRSAKKKAVLSHG